MSYASCATVAAGDAQTLADAKEYADELLEGGATPSGSAGGDLEGTYPNPTVKTATSAAAGKIAINNGATAGDATNATDALTAEGFNALANATGEGTPNAVQQAVTNAVQIGIAEDEGATQAIAAALASNATATASLVGAIPLASLTQAGLIEESTSEETRLGATDPSRADRAVTPQSMSYALQGGVEYPISVAGATSINETSLLSSTAVLSISSLASSADNQCGIYMKAFDEENQPCAGSLHIEPASISYRANLVLTYMADSVGGFFVRQFHPNNQETYNRFQIDWAGNTGVGVNNTGAYGKFGVGGSSYQAVYVQSTDASGAIGILAANSSSEVRVGSVTNHPVVVKVNNEDCARFTANGITFKQPTVIELVSDVPNNTFAGGTDFIKLFASAGSAFAEPAIAFQEVDSNVGAKISAKNVGSGGMKIIFSNRSASSGTSSLEVRAQIDTNGNFLIGADSGSHHQIVKATTGVVCGIGGSTGGFNGFLISDSTSNTYSTTDAVLKCGSNGGRAINASGTVNASGADYAEYMTKAGDFVVAKGDVIGINAEGELTNVFDDAVSFCVKSTDPSYVGNDTWGRGINDDDLESARKLVDRVAFAGQVPVNVLNATPGDYIVPTNNNGAVKGEAIANPTFEQYKIAVGKVIAIEEDGRARIIVKVA
jgi:hypothetical protein